LNEDEVRSLTIYKIVGRLGVVFKNARAKYKLQGKEADEQEEGEKFKRRAEGE
jgi:hypothetical protein